MTAEQLMAFEDEIKELWLAGKIRSPVHLSRGNEKQLIEIFKDVQPHDWVFSTHRSHYHALLKGISPEWLRAEILANRSIHINSSRHHFFSSAIVAGALPIALGVALAIQRLSKPEKVWAFTGDMAAETGCFHECSKYARRNRLPITFVVENNGFSVNTPTQEVWGREYKSNLCEITYSYKRGFPHQGIEGQWVVF